MRKLKQYVYELLCMEDETKGLEEILKLESSKVVNSLFTFIQHGDETIKQRAVRAIGMVAADLASQNMESARIVMRRLMWSLNDESGGIGWGAPEAMGEIMARNETLAREYLNILLSYVDPKGNYLEYEPLRKGAVQAIKRLALARPDLIKSSSISILNCSPQSS